MDFAHYGSNAPIGSTICTAMGALRARIVKGAISVKHKDEKTAVELPRQRFR